MAEYKVKLSGMHHSCRSGKGAAKALRSASGSRQLARNEREPPGVKEGAELGAKFDKIHTKFRFFRASHDGSIVWVVFSFPAGNMGDGANLDKTRPYRDGFKKVSDGKTKMGVMRPMIRNSAKVWQ